MISGKASYFLIAQMVKDVSPLNLLIYLSYCQKNGQLRD